MCVILSFSVLFHRPDHFPFAGGTRNPLNGESKGLQVPAELSLGTVCDQDAAGIHAIIDFTKQHGGPHVRLAAGGKGVKVNEVWAAGNGFNCMEICDDFLEMEVHFGA